MEAQIFSKKDELWLNQHRTGYYSKQELIRLLWCNIAVDFVLDREVLLVLFSYSLIVFICLLISSFGLVTWVYLVGHFVFYQFYLKYMLDGTLKNGSQLINEGIKILRSRLNNQEYQKSI